MENRAWPRLSPSMKHSAQQKCDILGMEEDSSVSIGTKFAEGVITLCFLFFFIGFTRDLWHIADSLTTVDSDWRRQKHTLPGTELSDFPERLPWAFRCFRASIPPGPQTPARH